MTALRGTWHDTQHTDGAQMPASIILWVFSCTLFTFPVFFLSHTLLVNNTLTQRAFSECQNKQSQPWELAGF